MGRAIGARETRGPRRAWLVGEGMAVLYMSLSALTFLVFGRQLAQLFSPDPGVVDNAVQLDGCAVKLVETSTTYWRTATPPWPPKIKLPAEVEAFVIVSGQGDS